MRKKKKTRTRVKNLLEFKIRRDRKTRRVKMIVIRKRLSQLRDRAIRVIFILKRETYFNEEEEKFSGNPFEL